jgi:glycosyltransferase involved in cell wall biosynthesis
VNWVITPPAPGSGGHTTLFRIVRYLEEHGYRNHIYFYDVYRSDHRYYEAVVRNYYKFFGPVSNVEDGMQDAHVVMATAWQSAYPIFNSKCAGKRFYFIQDFEPDFFPAGSMRLLTENTYRMGFHGLSIGQCFAERLRHDFGMHVETFKYGCDTSQYHRVQGSQRNGIVFYARRETARRGFELGMMALEAFAARRPDIEIHIYGDKIGKLPFNFFDHGHITPAEINTIYNRCYAGLSLSFTNVSLVALEMLAAGCIAVVNDTEFVRTDLNNPHARYTAAYPAALAAELESVTMSQNFESLSEAAAASVRTTTWDEAGNAVDTLLRRSLRAGIMPLEHAALLHEG